MINDELRKQINDAQRMKCFQSSIISVLACILWIMLFNVQIGANINKYDIILVTICAVIITMLALAVIFCNMCKSTFELEAKNDPTKG